MNEAYPTEIAELFVSLQNRTAALESDVNKYLNTFDIDAMIAFGNSEETRKKYLGAYNRFTVKLKMHIEKYEEHIALLSQLICDADNRCDNELTEKLSSEFDNYSDFFVSVKQFISNCEAVFLDKENVFRPSTILGHTRALLSAVKIYKEKI